MPFHFGPLHLFPPGERFLGVQAWRYAVLLFGLLTTLAAGRTAKWFFETYALRLAAKTRWQGDDLVLQGAAQPASLLVHSLGIYAAVMFVLAGVAPQAVGSIFGKVCFGVAAGALLWYVYRLIEVADHYLRMLAARSDNDFDDSFVDILRKTFRLFVVVVGGMFIGRNVLDWDITAVLASAGVLGLAVAFAAQDTIANFFGTLMLLVDKPFKVGDRVIVQGAEGPVEAIGFRSTRIRTLDGHQVSIPNKEVANAKVENVGRRPFIKRVTNLGITYDTPVVKVERALAIVRGILRDHKGMDPAFPPRVHFTEFNDCSLNL